MHVALAGTGSRDPNQLGLLLQFGNRRAAAVTHSGSQPAHHLVDHRRGAALVGDASFDAFGHQLVRRPATLEIELVLEVAVAAAFPHGTDRSHAAVFLVGPSLKQDQLARALVSAGEQVADHRAARPDGQRLDDVARVADATVGDDRNVAGGGGAGAVHDRADHRHADAGDHAGRADRAGTDADLDGVHAGVDESERRFGGGNVAGDQLGMRKLPSDTRDHLDHTL